MTTCDKHPNTKLITGYCPQCEWNATGDEFLIIACDHRSHPDRKWTRKTLEAAKWVADLAATKLVPVKASVYNIHNGVASNALYVVTPSGGKDMVENESPRSRKEAPRPTGL